VSLAILKSRALAGMSAPEVTVEAHLANGLPSFTIVGLPEAEVKVARTIADLANASTVGQTHIAEAIQYRRALREH